jgi:hypothetical protein
MRIAYLDTIAGISGDMTLGAFISAGVSLDPAPTSRGCSSRSDDHDST